MADNNDKSAKQPSQDVADNLDQDNHPAVSKLSLFKLMDFINYNLSDEQKHFIKHNIYVQSQKYCFSLLNSIQMNSIVFEYEEHKYERLAKGVISCEVDFESLPDHEQNQIMQHPVIKQYVNDNLEERLKPVNELMTVPEDLYKKMAKKLLGSIYKTGKPIMLNFVEK